MSGIFWFVPDSRHRLALLINWNIQRPVMPLLRFFQEKNVFTHFNHAPGYSYVYAAFFGLGLFVGTWARVVFASNDVCFRRSEYHKPWPDKHYLHAHSMPYYNHWLRGWLSRYRSSMVDNEPDIWNYHPWNLRPNRNMHYARFPFIYSIPRYFIDDPNWERNLHANMERKYEELGYYPDRKKKAKKGTETEEPEEKENELHDE